MHSLIKASVKCDNSAEGFVVVVVFPFSLRRSHRTSAECIHSRGKGPEGLVQRGKDIRRIHFSGEADIRYEQDLSSYKTAHLSEI